MTTLQLILLAVALGLAICSFVGAVFLRIDVDALEQRVKELEKK